MVSSLVHSLQRTPHELDPDFLLLQAKCFTFDILPSYLFHIQLGCPIGNTVRVTRDVTHPFSPLSMQPTAATNKDTAATTYVRGMQEALVRELDFCHIYYGCHRGKCSHIIAAWRNNVQIYKLYFLVSIPTKP